jgi:hypothetical protein
LLPSPEVGIEIEIGRIKDFHLPKAKPRSSFEYVLLSRNDE